MKKMSIILLSLSVTLFSQMLGDYNHPELKWRTVETEHFIFHYHEGTEMTTLRFADVGERVYGPITTLYNYYPEEKINVVVADYEDTANGGAYYYTNKMVLWAPAFDTELRGNHFWHTNVFTHEFSHMIQLQLTRKTAKPIPGLYFQWTGYEREKREDVLTGFPNVLASVNLPFNIIPPWFAEGIAQNQALDTLYYDFWGSNRDMLFRERVMSDQTLRYEQLMDFTNKSAHEAETIYNTGFAFTKYLQERFGKKVLYDISEELGEFSSFTFEKSFKKVLGVDPEQLYNKWISEEKTRYREMLSDILNNICEGKNISDSAFVNSHPRYSPDGTKLAFLSTKDNGEATYYRKNLYIKDIGTDSVEATVPGVLFSSFSWSPDSKYIYFSRIDTHSIYGNQYLDIFKYDIEKEEEEKVTHGLRAGNPTVSSDGKKIAYVASSDGSRNVYLLELESGKSRALTEYIDGTQFYLPRWNREGTALLTDKSGTAYGRNIVLVDTAGTETVIVADEYDNRDPVFSKDHRSVYFSSDRTGIFNIYKRDIDTGKTVMVTNVRGGAFYPEPYKDSLVYVNYKGIKTNLYKIDAKKCREPDDKAHFYKDYKILSEKYEFEPDFDLLENSKNYSNDFEQMLIVPRISFDDNKFKPGMYFFMNDYLEKISVFGGFGAAFDGDYDIFGQAEYKFLLPTLYGLAIKVVKNDDNTFLDETIIVDEEQNEDGDWEPVFKENDIKFTYDLTEFDFGIKTPLNFVPKKIRGLFGRFYFDGYFAYLRNDAKADYGDFILQYTYFKERAFHFGLNINKSKFDYNYYINPIYGRDWNFSYSRHHSDFITGFNLNSDYGTLQEDYIKYNYNQYSADLKENFGPYFKTGMTVRLKGSYIDDDDIDSFYYNYIGGISGLKGYSFYSLGGTKTVMGGAYFRFPVIERTEKKFGFFNFKNLYAGMFFEAGSAWTDEDAGDVFKYVKKDIGFNLRLFGTLFYGHPVSIEYTAAYGLD
ncbi:MAG: hypothetical protein R6V47_01685, partial [Candidatus Delongbacteria bacterium]